MPTASGILCAAHTPQEELDTVNIANIITELFCKIDDAIPDAPRHSQAILSGGEVVTISILYAVKGVSQRAFYPWLRDNYGYLFPQTAGTLPPVLPATHPTIPNWTLPGRSYSDGHCRQLRRCAAPSDATPDKSDARAFPITAGL